MTANAACRGFILAVGLVLLATACAVRGEAPVEPSGLEGRDPPPTTGPAEPVDDARARVRIGPHLLLLDVAADWDSRGRGLSGRRSLPEDGGMIFVYPRAEPRSFWMKGCLIGLDVAFVDDFGRIIDVVSLDPPAEGTSDAFMPRARSARPARFVVETRKGWFAEKGIEVGTLVELPPELIRLAEEENDDA